MLVPTNFASAVLIIVLVVPGFVYGSVRAVFHGATSIRDTQLSSRVAGAVIVSIVFDATYLVAYGSLHPGSTWSAIASHPLTLVPRDLASVGFWTLLLGFGLPSLMALVRHLRLDWVPAGAPGPLGWVRVPRRRGGYRNFPSAWDRAVPGAGGTFVRVRLEDGKWIGGWYSSDSSVSTYPHARDLFIEEQYNMDRDGSFGDRVEGSSGVWLAVTDDRVVEWVTSTERSSKARGSRNG